MVNKQNRLIINPYSHVRIKASNVEGEEVREERNRRRECDRLRRKRETSEERDTSFLKTQADLTL